MKCFRCRADSRPGVRFCEDCGAPQFYACPRCAAELLLEKRYCGACGAENERWAADPAPDNPALAAAHAPLESERKLVTVLFADIKGSMALIADRDPEEARELLDGSVEQMITAVHRYGGLANQVMGDGIMAIFGAPVAHEDHAVRACYAALAMHDLIRRHVGRSPLDRGVEVRVGLSSGEALLRSIRSDVRLEYTAQGRIVHLGARMEQLAAPGTTLLTGDTFALVKGHFKIASRGRISVKGLTEEIDCHELLGVEPTRTRLETSIAVRGLSHFVGREDQLERLIEVAASAGAGQGRIACVVGEPGIGKSRLVAELVLRQELAPWTTLVAQTASYAGRTAYFALAALLRQYFAIDAADSPASAQAKIRDRAAAEDVGEVSALLWLLDMPANDSAWEAIEPAAKRQKVIDAVTALLVNESRRRPLLLVLEDAHWVDRETQRVIDALAALASTSAMMLLVTCRPEYERPWRDHAHYLEQHLSPLTEPNAERLLGPLIGDHASLAEIKQRIFARTEGNPFFLEETVRALIGTGELTGAPGNYRLAVPIESVRIPASVEGVLASRIDRLPASAKHLLQSAAVIGKDIALSLLEAVAAATHEGLRSSIETLLQSGLWYEKTLFPEPEYTFRHALTHEVAYKGLLRARRKTLHAGALDAIERLHGQRLAEHVDDLARHALGGELWDKAVHYLHQAGTQAAGRSAHHDALSFFNEALAALRKMAEDKPSLERGIELHFAARNSLWALSEQGKILGHLREAQALAEKLNDSRTIGRVTSFMIQHHRMAGDHQAALTAAERGLAIAEELKDFELTIDTNFRAGLTCLSLGDFRRAEQFFQANIRQLDAGTDYARPGTPGLPSVLSRAWLCIALAERGAFDRAIACGAEAVAIAEQADHKYSLVSALFGQGAAVLQQGDVVSAQAVLQRAMLLCRQYRIPVLEGPVLSELAHAHTLQGAPQDAIPLLERVVEPALAQTTARRALYLARLGEAYLAAGRIDDATTTCRMALELSGARNERGHAAWALRLQAEIALRAGDAQAAIASYAQAHAISQELDMKPLAALTLLGRSRALSRLRRHDEAEQDLGSARRLLTELKMELPEHVVEQAPSLTH